MLEKVIKQRAAHCAKDAMEDVESQGITLVHVIKLKKPHLNQMQVLYIFFQIAMLQNLRILRESWCSSWQSGRLARVDDSPVKYVI